MKKIGIALIVLGLYATEADAQSSAHSKFAKNYPVCLVGNHYEVCSAAAAEGQQPGRSEEIAGFGMQNTYVHMGYSNRGNARYRSRIRVTYDEPGAVYEGKNTMTNGGVRKNKLRNLNTNNGAYDLPPSDGRIGF